MGNPRRSVQQSRDKSGLMRDEKTKLLYSSRLLIHAVLLAADDYTFEEVVGCLEAQDGCV